MKPFFESPKTNLKNRDQRYDLGNIFSGKNGGKIGDWVSK
jgi:hypothetical protein